MPFTVMQMICGLLLPAVMVGTFAAAAWKSEENARWAWGLLLATGFGVAYWNLETRVGWPPSANVLYLLFYFGIVAGLLGCADALFRPPISVRIVVLVIGWRLAVRLLLAPQVPNSISGTIAEMWVDLSTLVTVVWWLIFESIAVRSPGVCVPLVLAGLAGAAAIFLGLGWHILGSGALAVSLAMVCLACAVLGAIGRRISYSRGFAETIVLMLQLLLVHGYFYTDDTLSGAQEAWIAILLASPVLALAGDLPIVRRRGVVARLAVRVVPMAIALGIVCGITVRDYARAQQDAAQQDE